MTIGELAALLKLTKKTIQNKMVLGIFRKGIHYFRRKGLGTRFKRSAVVAWVEESEEQGNKGDEESIPMARGYRMLISSRKTTIDTI